MPTTHTVQQGEYLSMIAKQYGFATHITLWDHEKNKDLKEKRKNPNILFPGDEVFIPDKEQKQVDATTQQLTTFRAKRDKLKLRLVLEELYGDPIANAQCEIRIDGKSRNAVTGEDGTVEIEVPLSVKTAELTINEEGGKLQGATIPIKIGHVDPVEEPTGQIARLNNLGYFAGPFDQVDERLFKSAVEEFQCDHKLTVDGICGPATQAKLKEAHGC